MGLHPPRTLPEAPPTNLPKTALSRPNTVEFMAQLPRFGGLPPVGAPTHPKAKLLNSKMLSELSAASHQLSDSFRSLMDKWRRSLACSDLAVPFIVHDQQLAVEFTAQFPRFGASCRDVPNTSIPWGGLATCSSSPAILGAQP